MKVIVKGDRALFTRPEFSVERYTYDFITPSACKGLLKSVYWKPQMEYIINSIKVINPIKYVSIMRNELSNKLNINKCNSIDISNLANRQQRFSTILKDVEYVIDFDIILIEPESERNTLGKHYHILKDRIDREQFYRVPCLGLKEFDAWIERGDKDSTLKGTKDFGLCLFDLDYSDESNYRPIMFNAIMNDGVIDVKNAQKWRCV